MADFVYRRQFAIEWGHCDPAGIVFNPRFFEFFDRSAWLMFEAALGVPLHELAKTYGIVGIPLVDAKAKFLAPAAFGDVAEIESRIVAFRRSSFEVEHRMFVKGALAAEGYETRVWAGPHPDDPLRMKARAVPHDVITKFQDSAKFQDLAKFQDSAKFKDSNASKDPNGGSTAQKRVRHAR